MFLFGLHFGLSLFDANDRPTRVKHQTNKNDILDLIVFLPFAENVHIYAAYRMLKLFGEV